MSHTEKVSEQRSAFLSAEEFLAVKSSFYEFSGTTEYLSLERYYHLANERSMASEKLAPVKLFQEAFESLLRQKTTSSTTLRQAHVDLKKYAARLSNTVAMLSKTAAPVPKIMHFVWVGGSEVGAIQRDYMNIWRKVLASEGYTFNLWYDSDALLAFEMNRVILDSSRVHAMESGGDQVTDPVKLARMIEDRARVLKRQMADYLNQPQWVGRADEARIDLMVRTYGKDRAVLEAFRRKCLDTHLEVAGQDLLLRDVRHEFADHYLKDVYQREVAMRGNFAAASDVVRLQAEYLEGGRYSDMDYLPPLAETLGGIDTRSFSEEARIGFLQLLLNANDALMPGRDKSRYADRTDKIPAEHKEALVAFARGKPDVREIFVAPRESQVPENAIRFGTASSHRIAGEMNAHFLAHPESAMTSAYMQMIRVNYDCLYEVERRLVDAGITREGSDRLYEVILSVIDEKIAEGRFPTGVRFDVSKVVSAIGSYYQDGIRIGARGTIALTGPGAAVAGLMHYVEAHLLPDYVETVRDHLKLTEGYNVFTEEEMISGWTVNGQPEEWLKNEQAKWKAGKLKSRYLGDITELLKEQKLTFNQGWPVIEGKPVLLTSVLQQLMDDLGEPFVRAMRDKLSGEITLNKEFFLGFDARQQIFAQPSSEIPPAVGAQIADNLNSLFTLIEHGSLPVEQLSPLQRVVLGGLFGAQSLDADGFAGAWQEALKTAKDTADGGLFARYHVIEKILRQHNAPAFEAGLARGGVPDKQTSRELKALALTDLLTLRKWGQRIELINRTAQREYQTQILKRGGQVREAFFKAGAISARQMPQDLLRQTPNDPGRRCYPLALLMAAAVTRGESAERALIGRIANAGLAPDDADSRALLLALDELHAVPVTDVGQTQGNHKLEDIIQTLEAKTESVVLLLDTGNHALLVAKILTDGKSVYCFYEPNFAIYGFEQTQQLKQGIERYLSAGKAEMARLYGLADATNPQFDVIELNTATIADTVFSSSLRLDSFLHNAPITEVQAHTVWEKQAVGRTRSLTETTRMGASLVQLDGRYWAREFNQATSGLLSENDLGREYLPLLETVQERSDASYTLTLVDARNPQRSISVTTSDSRFSKLKKHIQHLVETVAGKGGAAGDADGGSRLSFAFAIQTILAEMTHREYQAGEGQVPTLSIAFQVQVYVSYAQLTYGVVSDAVQLVSLVRQIAASEQALAARQSSLVGRLAGRVSTGAGIGFSLVNIGFDIYGLTQASNQEQRSRLATQLVFDVAALGLDIAALAVGGTVGGAAAILSVPLLGVGIGVAAIASNLGQISDKAIAVGAHLRKIQGAYSHAVYKHKDSVLTFEPEAVITHLDLQSNQIRFDSQKFYPMQRGGLELPQYDNRPEQMHRAIDIREALELPGSLNLIRPAPGIKIVVLPCTPVCYYGYEYQLGSAGYPYEPSAEEFIYDPPSDSEILIDASSLAGNIASLLGTQTTVYQTDYPNLRNRAVSKLEFDGKGERRFYFFANTPLPHILYKLYPVHKPTHIVVTMDQDFRQLLVPQLPAEWKNLLSYEIITRSQGMRQLWLTPGLVSVSLESYPTAQWVIHAPWVSEAKVIFEQSFISIDGIQIVGFVDFIELEHGELFQIDRHQKKLVLLSVTLQEQGEAVNYTALNRIRERARQGRQTSAYVSLNSFKVPFNPEARDMFVKAFYNVAQNRTLYARNLPDAVKDGVVLGAANGEYAWFYHPERATVWRVDAITGVVRHRYRLMNPESGSKIIGCGQSADGLRVSQRMLDEQDGVETTLEYMLFDESVELCSVTSDTYVIGKLFEHEASVWTSLIDRFKSLRPYADETPGMASDLSNWVPAQCIAIGMSLGGWGYVGGLRLADSQLFLSGRPVGQELDTVMLMLDYGKTDTPLFYSKQEKLLRHGVVAERTSVVGSRDVMERDVIEVTKTGGHYIATKSDGRLFEVAKDGVLRFIGVSQHWLGNNPDWLTALAELVHGDHGAPFPVVGLSNATGRAVLAAWYIDKRFLVADIGQGKELVLLGLTPDKQAAWLFDVSAGQLYRQTLMSLESLRPAFAEGTRLLHAEQLPVAQKVWSPWVFAEVLTLGQGLLGRTREGVNLELQDNQPARILSVENQWSYVEVETSEDLQARLKALLQGQEHAPVLRVQNIPDRYTYYVPELDRLFNISGRFDGEWAEFLGTRNESVPMLFDPVDGLIFTRGEVNDIRITGSHAHRDGEVLSLEMSGEITDLLSVMPDGVDKLILAFGSRTLTYRVSDEAWQRLDCIVVDTKRFQEDEGRNVCTLALDMAGNERLVMSFAEEHLVITDPDSAHSLIVRDVKPKDDVSGTPIQVSIRVHGRNHVAGVEQWREALALAQGDEGYAVLEKVILKVKA